MEMSAKGNRRTELAYQYLREALSSGQISPREHLQPELLGPSLKISRTPVRDALIRLEAQGLVESVPHHGFFARAIDEHELRNLYGFAHGILRHAVTGPKYKGSRDWSEFNFELSDAKVASNDAQLAADIEAFYLKIAAMSGNELTIASIDTFNIRTHIFRVQGMKQASIATTTLAALRRVDAAVRNGGRHSVVHLIDKLFAHKLTTISTVWTLATVGSSTKTSAGPPD